MAPVLSAKQQEACGANTLFRFGHIFCIEFANTFQAGGYLY